ncbi:excalibur calcium-binding domain-containing protein [Corynebacterium riegelii]
MWNDLGRPIYRNDPGFGSHLDRDGDGKGCERRPR